MMRAAVLTALLACVSCTPGALGSASSGGASDVVIDVNLSMHPATTQPQGGAGGYAPLPLTISLGTTIRFVNGDNANHTATIIQAASFPVGSPLSTAATVRSGVAVSNFSTGTLAPQNNSQTITADSRGTFLYGCFYHYGAPMRGVIIVQ